MKLKPGKTVVEFGKDIPVLSITEGDIGIYMNDWGGDLIAEIEEAVK